MLLEKSRDLRIRELTLAHRVSSSAGSPAAFRTLNIPGPDLGDHVTDAVGTNEWRYRPDGAISLIGRTGSFLSLALVDFIVTFLFIDWFAASVFPAVPEQFGGGKPKTVTLILDSDSQILQNLKHYAVGSEGDRIDVQLMWEGEHTYLVGPIEPYMQIAREQVRAVILTGTELATPTPASPTPMPADVTATTS